MAEQYGWTGNILRINLSNHMYETSSVIKYADRFIGGRGLASRLYWDDMGNNTRAFDSDSYLYFMNGPLSGGRAPAASRWVVLGKSPMAVPEQYASGNLGGVFGAALKWAGLDGLVITGSSARPVVLLIEPGLCCTFVDAQALWGTDTIETIGLLEGRYAPDAYVAAIGPAGEMKVRFATIIASGGAVATKGFGAVMGSKNLKAIVVKAQRTMLPEAQPDDAKRIRHEITSLWRGNDSGRFWSEIVFDDIVKVKNEFCFGCPGICRRGIYQTKGGVRGHRKPCVSSLFYYREDQEKTGKISDATFMATELANRNGLCMLEIRFLLHWLPEAITRGLIDPVATGLGLNDLGTVRWMSNLIDLIVSRKGPGDILAEGSRRSAQQLGAEDLLRGLVTRTGFDADFYSPRLFIVNAPIYATEPVYPITMLHRISFPMLKWMIWMGTEGMMGFLTTEKLRNLAKAYWGDEQAAEFDTPIQKAQAAILNQNRCYAMENMVFCDWFWPIDFSNNTESGLGDPSLEARLFSAVTGVAMDEKAYLLIGERCVNLCRAIYLREGRRGRTDDVLEDFNHTTPLEVQEPPIGLFNPELIVPAADGSTVSRIGAVVERDIFKTLMDEYYNERGWDVQSGLPTTKCFERLALTDIAPDLKARGLLT